MKKRLLFTLGCSFTEGDGGYPPEPFFEPEGIPLDGSRRDELHGTEVMQNYRNINMNQCDLIQQIPADEDFWVYFNENIYPMSAGQKFNFMNS